MQGARTLIDNFAKAERERNAKLRAAAGAAFHPDLTLVRLYNVASDCKTHARAGYWIGAIRGPIELSEYLRLLGFGNTGAFIVHSQDQTRVGQTALESDWCAGRGIFPERYRAPGEERFR